MLTIERARSLTTYAEERDMFVQSIEAFDLLEDDYTRLNLEFSLLGLRYDEHAATSPQDINAVARSIYDLVERLEQKTGFDIWLAPNDDFTPVTR
ncbi:MAG: hypothetical protein EON93_09255 [Burkholderiales bacterium]|nr:MAG: hypothetical protein EON93_09255 [Burkholderiales bacterium]